MTARSSFAIDVPASVLARARAGERSAFEQLYRTTSSRLFGVCLRIVNQRSEAEDVLQDVFTNVWRKAQQFDPQRASGVTWLTMMARNKAIDHLLPVAQAASPCRSNMRKK